MINSPTQDSNCVDNLLENPTGDNKSTVQPETPGWQYYQLCKELNKISEKLDNIEIQINNTEQDSINHVRLDGEEKLMKNSFTDINSIILNEIRDLRAENKIISNTLEHVKTENALRYENLEKQNNNVKNTVTILISVFGLIISVFFAVLNITVNSINKNIDSLEKNNSMQIQRDVAVEVKNQLSK